jgi:hypothetical protein
MKPEPTINPGLAPDTNGIAGEAVSALEQQVQIARVTNDPLLYVLQALTTTVRAMQENVEAMQAAQKQPISQETLENLGRTALILVEREVGALARERLRAWIVSAAIAAFGIFAAGLGIGWAIHGDGLDRACLSRGEIRTDKDGNRFCVTWIAPAPRK